MPPAPSQRGRVGGLLPGSLPPGRPLSPCLSPAALLYKPVDRVTRSTLVLHVSPWGPGPPHPGADAVVCQLCPAARLSAPRLY